MDGVLVSELKIIKNDKGSVMHALKSSDSSFLSFGEAYFSSVNFNVIKGWKKHKKMQLNLVVPVGAIKFVLFDDRQASKTFGEFYEIELSAVNYCRLSIPPNIWVAFQGINHKENLLLNVASIEHDPDEADVLDLNKINYNWGII